jgi:hypothetical protein
MRRNNLGRLPLWRYFLEQAHVHRVAPFTGSLVTLAHTVQSTLVPWEFVCLAPTMRQPEVGAINS